MLQWRIQDFQKRGGGRSKGEIMCARSALRVRQREPLRARVWSGTRPRALNVQILLTFLSDSSLFLRGLFIRQVRPLAWIASASVHAMYTDIKSMHFYSICGHFYRTHPAARNIRSVDCTFYQHEPWTDKRKKLKGKSKRKEGKREKRPLFFLFFQGGGGPIHHCDKSNHIHIHIHFLRFGWFVTCFLLSE